MRTLLNMITCSLLGLSITATAQEVIRHSYDSDFPIAAAVEVPADKTLVYLGGTVPSISYPEDTELPADVTYEQTVNVLNNLKQKLEDLDLTLGDIVQMQVFLVGVPQEDGRLDFQGFMRGYEEYFGIAEQPNLPVRSVLQVAGLARPDWVVEIEVVAARP